MNERKSKNVFLIGYIMVMVVLVMMSSCGSGKTFHVGTGQETYKSKCGGTYIKR